MRVPLESIEQTTDSNIRFSPRVLNNALGGLFLPTQISLFHGSERAPLSILAHSAAVSAAKISDAVCVFLDSGSNYSPPLIRSLCTSSTECSSILKRVIVGQVLGLDDVVDRVGMLQDIGNVILVVLDSLTGVLNLTGSPGTKGRQRTLFGALDSIRRLINNLVTHVMITDHSTQNWTSREHQPIGGNVLSHAVDNVVHVDRLSTGDDVFRILIERASISPLPPGVVLHIGAKGIRSIR